MLHNADYKPMLHDADYIPMLHDADYISQGKEQLTEGCSPSNIDLGTCNTVKCSVCTAGKYSSSGLDCQDCVDGSVAPGTGTKECTICQPVSRNIVNLSHICQCIWVWLMYVIIKRVSSSSVRIHFLRSC